MTELKDLFLKPGSSPLVTTEFLSQKFLFFEYVLHKNSAPLSQLASILPTNVPPVVTWVQGGELKYVVEGASVKTSEEAKVVGKILTTNIPTTKPIISNANPMLSTVTNTRQVLKGIVIGSNGEGSASKLKEILRIQDRGKKVVVEKKKKRRQRLRLR